MEELIKRVTHLRDLIKAIKNASEPKQSALPKIPAIKKPTAPPMTPPGGAKDPMVGKAPEAKKDPKKVAQQIKDGSMSTKTQKIMLKTQENGQWYLDKADSEFNSFHIHRDGHQITAKPVNLEQIKNQYGSVQRLESSGHRLNSSEAYEISIISLHGKEETQI